MAKDFMIEVIDVSKRFKVYEDRSYTLKDSILNTRSKKYRYNEALKNINLSIVKGECVGLIGINGSGKSTLLKLITKILYPTSGSIKTYGKIASLLELGAGFNDDFTGLENIYINGAIFGLKKKDIDKIVNNIIDFSELGDAIYSPVRTYSSGMYMRLAFSVAIHVNADILMIDEILAVGDSSFKEKCYRKIEEIKKSGVTIVIVSHEMDVIKKFCDRGIVLTDYQVSFDGDINSAIHYYNNN